MKKISKLLHIFLSINFKLNLYYLYLHRVEFLSEFAKGDKEILSNDKKVILMFLKTINVNFESVKIYYKKLLLLKYVL